MRLDDLVCCTQSERLIKFLQGDIPSRHGRHSTSTAYYHPILSSKVGQHPTMVCVLDIRSIACHSLDDVCILHYDNITGPKETDQTHPEREDRTKNRGGNASIQGACGRAPRRHQLGC